MQPQEILSDFEELIKIRTFQEQELLLPTEATIERISHALKEEYAGNIDEKVNRWIDVTVALYFKDVIPIRFYLQAKMLYRDGFYEATITISRSICEMVCYHLLASIDHPFGAIEQIELENFRTLVGFLAIPKKVSKDDFEKGLIEKIANSDDKNFVKSSYIYDKVNKEYGFKTSNGKKPETINKFFKICLAVGFTNKDNFRGPSFDLINKVYDEGNKYVHARTSDRTAKEDARTSLFNIGSVLFDLYGIEDLPIGQHIISGYTDFPDICQGMGFAMDVYLTPEDAQLGYYNLPLKKHTERMLSLNGKWKAEWTDRNAENTVGEIEFTLNGEYLNAKLAWKDKIYDYIGIKLFGAYFRLLIFDPETKELQVSFDLKWFSDYKLIGSSNTNDQSGIALLSRI